MSESALIKVSRLLLALVLIAPAACLPAEPEVIEAAEREFRGEGHIDWFLTQARRRIDPDRWGDAWIEYEGDLMVVNVGVVEPNDRHRRKLQRITAPGIRAEVVAVRYSAKQLSSFADSAGRVLLDFDRTYSLAVAPEVNRVEAYVQHPNEVIRDALETEIPENSYRLLDSDELPDMEIGPVPADN